MERGQRRSLNEFNKAPGKNGIALFTSDYGTSTPRISGSYSVLLSALSRLDSQHRHRFHGRRARPERVGADRPRDGGARRARESPPTKLQAEAPVGTTVALRLILQPGVGHGRRRDRRRPGARPRAVGRCIARTRRSRPSLLAPRHPRTRGRSDGRRSHSPRRRRRSPVRVLGRHDDVRDGPDARPARRGTGDAARRRRLVDPRLRRQDPEPAFGRDRATDLECAHALLLRRLRAAARSCRSSRRTATASAEDADALVQGRTTVERHRHAHCAGRYDRALRDRRTRAGHLPGSVPSGPGAPRLRPIRAFRPRRSRSRFRRPRAAGRSA